jgi:PAS domain S-box-containing protein
MKTKTIPHILLLEDNARDVDLLRARLHDERFECELVVVRKQAEFEAALAQDRFDLILSDYNLPDYDGLSALKFAHHSRPEIPFIFLSGTLGEERAVESLQHGAADYIVKTRPQRLVPALRRGLQQSAEHQLRLAVEASLKEADENLRMLATSAPGVLWMSTPDMSQILYVSPTYETLWGRSVASAYANPQSFTDAVHPEDREHLRQRWACADGERFQAEYRIVRPDGSVRWIYDQGGLLRDAAGKAIRFGGFAADITGRKRAEEALRETREELQTIYDSVPLPIIGFDTEGQVVSWSKGAESLFGWSEAEAVGSLCLTVDPSDREDFLQMVRRVSAGETIGHLIRSRRKKNGDLVQVSIACAPMRLNRGGGKAAGALVILADVTMRLQAEKQALRSQRLESIGTLAGGVAHDLNNVLAPIMMSLELLKLKLPDVEDQDLLTTMDKSCRRGADLIKQVLGFARGVEGQRIPVDLGHLLRDLLTVMRDTFPKNIDVRCHTPAGRWSVTGDPTQLHQVLLNLCVNARDAMPQGGTLAITLDNVTIDDTYAGMNPDSQPGAYLALQVADTGTGIPRDIQERIFEPFFTTKEIGKGTGLGLSTTMAIVKSHGGFINLYSEEGKGTKFKVYLPASTGDSAVPESAQAAAALPRGNQELVLVVDDEEAIRKITKNTLERFGYRVLLARNGAEAVATYAQKQREVAVVLTDMAMPIMDGPTTIAALKSMNPAVRIIAASGLTSHEGVAKAVGMGIEHFLPKPYTAKNILEVLNKVLAG